jgi:hypothetical protein
MVGVQHKPSLSLIIAVTYDEQSEGLHAEDYNASTRA